MTEVRIVVGGDLPFLTIKYSEGEFHASRESLGAFFAGKLSSTSPFGSMHHALKTREHAALIIDGMALAIIAYGAVEASMRVVGLALRHSPRPAKSRLFARNPRVRTTSRMAAMGRQRPVANCSHRGPD